MAYTETIRRIAHKFYQDVSKIKILLQERINTPDGINMTKIEVDVDKYFN